MLTMHFLWQGQMLNCLMETAAPMMHSFHRHEFLQHYVFVKCLKYCFRSRLMIAILLKLELAAGSKYTTTEYLCWDFASRTGLSPFHVLYGCPTIAFHHSDHPTQMKNGRKDNSNRNSILQQKQCRSNSRCSLRKIPNPKVSSTPYSSRPKKVLFRQEIQLQNTIS